MSKIRTLTNPLSGSIKAIINPFLMTLLFLSVSWPLIAEERDNVNRHIFEDVPQNRQGVEVFPLDDSDTAQSDSSDLERNKNEHSQNKEVLDVSSYNSFDEESGWVNQIWGRPSRNHLYLGMWTLHLDPGDDQENNNELVGFSYKGYFGGAFINTHSDRVWSAGWQRTLFQERYGEFDVEAGYRAGIMYGYKKYLTLYDTRFFPLVQALLGIDYKGFGVELSWAGVVLTAGFYYRF